MERVWRDAPVAALEVRVGPPLRFLCNPSAEQWGGSHGLGADHWQVLAERAMSSDDDLFNAVLGPAALPVHCRRVPLTDGLLLWVTPAARDDAAGELPARLERALELAGVSVWRVDLSRQRVEFNAVGYAFMGIPPQAEGLTLGQVRELIHPDDRKAILEAADEALNGHHIVDAEARYAFPGGWRWLLTRRAAERDADGRAVALSGISMDISDRHAERARVSARIEQTALVAQVLGVGFWSLDVDTGTIAWDAQMYRLYQRSEVLPPPTQRDWIGTYVHASQRDGVQRQLDADVRQWAPSTLMTVQLAEPAGTERWVRCWTRRLVREDGRRIEVGVHLDVTEQRRVEAMQTEAERAARLSREKSAFMALMSHRLRTPLNAVLGFTQLLAQDSAEPLAMRQRERLARIDSAGHELLAMVDDVFELALLDTDAEVPVRLPFPLSQLIAQLHDAVLPLARQRGVQLKFDEEGVAATLATDRRRLVQALAHLISHGVRCSERGGWVGLQAHQAGNRCLLTLKLGGATTDTGEQRELAFDTMGLPQHRGGSGDELIGLDLVRQVLERLGAELEWPSVQGALRVSLPLAETASDRCAVGLKLLYIEDNPVNLMLVRELVAMRPGIRFHSADDGLSGLAVAAAERPDVVLLDLQLPDIPGAEVLARLRQDPNLSACTVIALSANAVPDEVRASRRAGFDDYWTKPIDFDRFLSGLDRLSAARG